MTMLRSNNDGFQPNEPWFEKRDSLWASSELYGYTVQAKDGQTGKVHDFYVDDQSWDVRYLVVDLGDWVLDTGQWTSGQKVIVPIKACDQPLKEFRMLPLTLPKEQVALSPTVDIFEKWPAKPSSWCSVKDVTGNYIKALDGKIGHVEDFIIDAKAWTIPLIVVDTKNWWPAKKVLVAPFWIDRIDLVNSTVFVDLPREFIKNRPAFNRKDISNLERVYNLPIFQHTGIGDRNIIRSA